MKKINTILLLLSLIILNSSPLWAQETKIITLTDGSTIKGQVIEFEDNIYTIETTHMGEIEVDDADIVSISNKPQLQNTSNETSPSTDQAQIKNQVQQMQGQILSDPAMMSDIEELMKDDNIRALLSDPSFIKDVMSYDPEKIKNNANTDDLLNNPEIKALMEKMGQKLSN